MSCYLFQLANGGVRQFPTVNRCSVTLDFVGFATHFAFVFTAPLFSGCANVRPAYIMYVGGRCSTSAIVSQVLPSTAFVGVTTLATEVDNREEPTRLSCMLRAMLCLRSMWCLQPQLLYLRHMCVFHHGGNLLKGTPGQLSVKLDIPEIVLRHLLEVGLPVVRLLDLFVFFVVHEGRAAG